MTTINCFCVIMLTYDRFKKLFLALFFVVCLLITTGNFFNLGIFSSKKINLGLDLKGGSHLLLEVDFDYYLKEQLENNADLLKNYFLENRIKALPKVEGDTIKIFYKDKKSVKVIEKYVKELESGFNIENAENTIILTFKSNYINEMKRKVNVKTTEIIRNRIDESGTRDALIQVEGNNRILVQVAGLSNSKELKELLGKTAKLTFHIVDTDGVGSNIIKLKDIKDSYELPLIKKPVLTGDMLTDASVVYEQGKPAINFKFNSVGAKLFSNITRDNMGKILAIVLDDKIVTAPRINGKIDGGTGVISGSFTSKEATEVALLLRAGSLIAPLSIVEEKTVGASLGQDLIEQGIKACIYGLVLVFVFLFVFYRHFGIFSNITLFINIVILVAMLSIFGVTLTLPGIAGIILTIGMSTDATILIFERIREENKHREEKTQLLGVIKNGFDSTLSTILDSNITTIIVAVILYIFGTGAIKGFAVILILGIFSSLVSSLVYLRRILDYYYKNKVLLIK